MDKHYIKNFNELATTKNRTSILEIIEAGLDAINTEKIIEKSISISGNILFIQGKEFDLAKYKNIKIIGFGKSSGLASFALEKILGSRITGGVVIDIHSYNSKYIEKFAGTHPRPSEANTEAGNKIFELLKDSKEDDLIIVLASGGGSALLCYPESEWVQGAKLYDSFLKAGKTINEINTVRKHLSLLKGGGLAKLTYGSTVIGLIFSDVPGDKFSDVASGPTYKDETTVEDAQKIITENNLGDFDLIETPKEDKYFEKVYNFVLVSNNTAVEAMSQKAKELGFISNIFSTRLYDEDKTSLEKIFSNQENNSVVLAAGEPKIKVGYTHGKGGRNLHMALEAINMKLINQDSIFVSFASDGMDNSDVAGAIIDKNTIEKINKLEINVEEHLEKFDSYPVFEKSGDMIITGPTGANVSDLMILLTKK